MFQVQNLKPDLIFLDVEMPEMTGFEFIRTLNGHIPKIIMVTAYPQYAIDGFEHQVTDYLLKPTSFERFMKAMVKVNEQLHGQTNITPPQNESLSAPVDAPEDEKKGLNSPNNFILIKEDKKLLRILPEEIQHVEAMKDYVKVYLENRVIVTHSTLAKMESLLPEAIFLRVNRSSILHINTIREIDGNQITTVNGKKIDIGVTYRDMVMSVLKK